MQNIGKIWLKKSQKTWFSTNHKMGSIHDMSMTRVWKMFKIIKKHHFLLILGGNGKFDAEAYFGHNPFSSIGYGFENHFLGFKSHSKPFKHVKRGGTNLYSLPTQTSKTAPFCSLGRFTRLNHNYVSNRLDSTCVWKPWVYKTC